MVPPRLAPGRSSDVTVKLPVDDPLPGLLKERLGQFLGRLGQPRVDDQLREIHDALLAYAMNGERLPIQHGYPLRLVVPGWDGVASVKWLSEIAAVERPSTASSRSTGISTNGPETVNR